MIKGERWQSQLSLCKANSYFIFLMAVFLFVICDAVTWSNLPTHIAFGCFSLEGSAFSQGSGVLKRQASSQHRRLVS